MIAIQIADFFLLRQDHSAQKADAWNFAIWLAGFAAYRLLMRVDIAVGNTLPDMLFTILVCLGVHRIRAAEKTK